MTALRPGDENELREAIAQAVSDGTALDLVGTGTKRAIGAPPGNHATTLDLSAIAGVVAYEPDELVLTLRAGTLMAEVEAMLAGSNQMMAFEPMDYGPLLGLPAGLGTIGGTIAANLAGPRRPSAGAARDHMLGLRAVSGRGEVFKAGGRVVKNVTGYDLPRALAGSWGTLAAFCELTIKVLPRPRSAETLLILGLDGEAAARAMSAAMGSPYDVSGAAHLPAAIAATIPAVAASGRSVTALRLEGVEPSIAHRRAVLQKRLSGFGELAGLDADASSDLWRAVRDLEPFAGGSGPVWRISAAPMAGHLIGALAEEHGGRHFCDWAGGLVWIELPREAHAQTLRAALAEAGGGHATLVRADETARREADVFQPLDPVTAALVARLKAAFDPAGVLNPGRMYR